MLAEERGHKIANTTSIVLNESYIKALKEIAECWGNVTTQSDIIRYCIWYTWKHAVKNGKSEPKKYQDI